MHLREKVKVARANTRCLLNLQIALKEKHQFGEVLVCLDKRTKNIVSDSCVCFPEEFLGLTACYCLQPEKTI